MRTSSEVRSRALNPPIPSEQISSTSLVAEKLATTTKKLERCNYSDVDALEDGVECLQILIAAYARRGLLQGDMACGEKILSTSNNSSQQQLGSSRKKRNRFKNQDEALSFMDGTESTNIGVGSSCTDAAILEVNHVMSSLARILGVRSSNGKASSQQSQEEKQEAAPSQEAMYINENKRLLVALAANVCTSVSQFIKSKPITNTCTIAEYDIMVTWGKTLLTGFERTARSLLDEIGTKMIDETRIQGSCLYETSYDCSEHTNALICCLRAAASLVGLLGTKLSRSTTLLANLGESGWKAIMCTNCQVQNAGVVLVATLPLIGGGGTDRLTPSSLWSSTLADYVALFSQLLKAVAPIIKTVTSSSSSFSTAAAGGDEIAGSGKEVIRGWIDCIHNAPSDSYAARVFLQAATGLSGLICCLLSQHSLGANKMGQQLIGSEVRVLPTLELVEMLTSFPIAAEAIYFRTKKRLRREPMDGGLISPTALISDEHGLANKLKLLGHEILASFIAAIGGPALLGYAHRIIRISNVSMLNSCSTPLRQVLDPTVETGIEMVGDKKGLKRRPWLHGSLPNRIASINMFQRVVLAFGSDTGGRTPNGAAESSLSHVSHVEPAIAIVCGSLVEQLSYTGKLTRLESLTGEWGSILDQVQMASVSAECLAACLSSLGGNMSMSTRRLVDSVVASCLSSIQSSHGTVTQHLCSTAKVKMAFLSLGMSSVCAPWPDGSGSLVPCGLRSAAIRCQYDPDEKVSFAAKLALAMSDANRNPRVPALQVVTQSTAFAQSSSQIVSAETMAEITERARLSINKSMLEEHEQEENKREMKRIHLKEAQNLRNKKQKINLNPARKTTEKLPPSTIQNSQGSPKDKKLSTKIPDEPVKARVSSPVSIPVDEPNATIPFLKPPQEERLNKANLSPKPSSIDSDDDIDEFPMIVDCGPDADDKD